MKTTQTIKSLALALCLSTVLFSCKKDNDVKKEEEHHEEKEHTFVRLMLADESTTTLTLLQPSSAKTSVFTADYPAASLYPTASGRYAAVLYRDNNLAEIFDSGLEFHVDHVDIDGNPTFTSFTSTGQKPTHFKSQDVGTLIFNDNSGTLSYATESDFSTANGTFREINAGLLPHHGAMAIFKDGNIAVTSAKTGESLPSSVLVIDKNGSTIHASTMEVSGIHGNATDGTNALFGAYKDASQQSGGVLVVSQDGTQKFIDNPAGFGALRMGTMLYAKAAKKFVGYSSAKGAYFVNVANNQITTIYSGDNAFQCKVDYAGKNLLILTLDGKLRVYDLSSGQLTKEGNVIAAVSTETGVVKPVMEATEHYAYITMPANGEVWQVSLEDFSEIVKHKVGGKPVKMALFGYEISDSHDH